MIDIELNSKVENTDSQNIENWPKEKFLKYKIDEDNPEILKLQF